MPRPGPVASSASPLGSPSAPRTLTPTRTFCAAARDGGHVHIRDIYPYRDFIAVLTPKVDSLLEVKNFKRQLFAIIPASAFPAHRTDRALEGGAAFGDGPMMILGEQLGEG